GRRRAVRGGCSRRRSPTSRRRGGARTGPWRRTQGRGGKREREQGPWGFSVGGWNHPRPAAVSTGFPRNWTWWFDWVTNPPGARHAAGPQPDAPGPGGGRVAPL